MCVCIWIVYVCVHMDSVWCGVVCVCVPVCVYVCVCEGLCVCVCVWCVWTGEYDEASEVLARYKTLQDANRVPVCVYVCTYVRV